MAAATDNSHAAGEDPDESSENIVWFDNYPQIRFTWICVLAISAIGGPITAMMPLSVPFPPQFMDMVPMFLLAAVGMATFSHQFYRTPKEVGISKESVHIRWRKRVDSYPITELQWDGWPGPEYYFDLRTRKPNSSSCFVHRDVMEKIFNIAFPEPPSNW